MSGGASRAASATGPATVGHLGWVGVPEAFSHRLIETFNRRSGADRSDWPLTPLQQEVFADPAFGAPRQNLLIEAPTSSGKTLVAQVAIAAALANSPGSRALYMLPLRALATEKAAELRELLPDRRVVAASADYPANDRLIAAGEWDVAVAVFDKVYRWLAEPAIVEQLLRDVAVVVVDELQVVAMQERGEKLETILSLLQWHRSRPDRWGRRNRRIIGMTAGADAKHGLQRWLGAMTLPRRPTPRPVRLIEGYVQPDGTFELFEDARAGGSLPRAAWPPAVAPLLDGLEPTKSPHSLTAQIATRCMARGLRAIVYVARKRDVESLARRVANQGRRRPVESVADAVSELEDSPVRDLLSLTLPRGVGFHHGDMTAEERALVETHFRDADSAGDVSVVVATPTLEMGINLPADVVLFRDHHIHGAHAAEFAAPKAWRTRYPNVTPIGALMYRNFAGRAGRLTPGERDDAFGLALMAAARRDTDVVERIIRSAVPPLRSTMDAPARGWSPAALVVSAALSAIADTRPEDVSGVLERSLLCATTPTARAEIRARVAAAVARLTASGFLDAGGDLTGVGKPAARYALCAGSAEEVLRLSAELARSGLPRRLDLIHVLVRLEEFARNYPAGRLPGGDTARPKFQAALDAFVRDRLPRGSFVPGGSLDTAVAAVRETAGEWPEATLTGVTRAAALWGWTTGLPITHLEATGAFPRISLGTVRQLGERAALFVACLRAVWEQSLAALTAPETSRQLWVLEQSLRYGVPEAFAVLPGLVAHHRNVQLPRQYTMAVGKSVAWSDVRELIGVPRPYGKPETWAAVQDALRRWADGSAADAGLVDAVLGEERPPTVTAVPSPARRVAALDPDMTAITGRAGQRRRTLERRHDSLEATLHSAVSREPMGGKLTAHPAFGFRRFMLRLPAGITEVILVDELVSATRRELRGRDRGTLLVCGRAPDRAVADATARKVRLLVTLDVLLTVSEMAATDPTLVPSLSALLIGGTGRATTPDDLLTLLREVTA